MMSNLVSTDTVKIAKFRLWLVYRDDTYLSDMEVSSANSGGMGVYLSYDDARNDGYTGRFLRFLLVLLPKWLNWVSYCRIF